MIKMPRAAVPDYLANADDGHATPELRFGLLLPIWSNQGWEKVEDSASKIWDKVNRLSLGDKERGAAFIKRQRGMASRLRADSSLSIEAKSVAPFATGLGNEHPLENGFSFLNPYGLPYLPGSGVKGVVRRAAEELAGDDWGGESGWTEDAIKILFGPPANDDHLARGALSFWDVMPQISGNGLMVEIMTPHYSHYYQQNLSDDEGPTSPHDSGQPNPISFLTVPPGSEFTFHIVYDRKRLKDAPDLGANERWKDLLMAAFEHAFDWCGFGAKTSVGYGQMKFDVERMKKIQKEEEARKTKEAQAEAFAKKTKDLPDDAKWVEEQRANRGWEKDRGNFLSDVEALLDREQEISCEAYKILADEFEKMWPGILEHPDATTQGKRPKPKFKPRQQNLAKQLKTFDPADREN
ncbi:MAG: hypothetical protein M2R45_05429 [Verrucomicrobia subdivision 3 bacterium]|nr:hypothetical protein [Limisphaerales bacterium]